MVSYPQLSNSSVQQSVRKLSEALVNTSYKSNCSYTFYSSSNSYMLFLLCIIHSRRSTNTSSFTAMPHVPAWRSNAIVGRCVFRLHHVFQSCVLASCCQAFGVRSIFEWHVKHGRYGRCERHSWAIWGLESARCVWAWPYSQVPVLGWST